MTSPVVTQPFSAAFDFALNEFIRTLKDAQDYLGAGDDLAAIGTLVLFDEQTEDVKAALRLFRRAMQASGGRNDRRMLAFSSSRFAPFPGCPQPASGPCQARPSCPVQRFLRFGSLPKNGREPWDTRRLCARQRLPTLRTTKTKELQNVTDDSSSRDPQNRVARRI